MGSNLIFFRFVVICGAAHLLRWAATPKTYFSSEQKPIHNTRFKTHPILIPVFGVSMGWLAAPGPSWPPIWGLGGSPKTSSRTSSRMSSKGLWPHKCPRMLLLGISTLDLGGLLYFDLGGGGERRPFFYNFNTEHIIILCTFATIGA